MMMHHDINSSNTMTNTRLHIYALVFILLGISITIFWFSLHNPIKPLFVELVNDTDKVIPTVLIEHGSPSLQEKIIIVQLKARERRVIALNHKPGMGFNVAVAYADGSKTEICAGKSKDYWFLRETITKFGIYTTPIR
jgi:hypothetical protein